MLSNLTSTSSTQIFPFFSNYTFSLFECNLWTNTILLDITLHSLKKKIPFPSQFNNPTNTPCSSVKVWRIGIWLPPLLDPSSCSLSSSAVMQSEPELSDLKDRNPAYWADVQGLLPRSSWHTQVEAGKGRDSWHKRSGKVGLTHPSNREKVTHASTPWLCFISSHYS